MSITSPLLQIEHLTIGFPGVPAPVVDDVSLSVSAGETLGVVGESGSGKSLTALSVVGLLPTAARVVSGRVLFQERELTNLSESRLREVRGAGIGFIFQEPMTALDPVMRVGDQIAEALEVHGRLSGRAARARAVELLRAVRISDPDRRCRDYPHQLSGGMRQRVMIAIALACRPPLVIADEPTTALDVTVQAQVLDLLRDLRQEYGLSLLLITHDFGVIAETADRVVVMHRGRIVEEGTVRRVLREPSHEYTRQLLAAVPGRAPRSGGVR